MLKKFKEMTWRQIVALIILAAADVFVIAAPYYIKGLFPNVHEYLNIKESDVAILTSIIGYVTLVTQLPGGFLANKFSSRWLLFLAVLSTGIITFWFGITIYSSDSISRDSLMAQYGTIFGLWGVSSTLIFWTPLWKLVSQQTTKENQGFAYGFQGTVNGVIGFLCVWLTGLIVTNVWATSPGFLGSKVPFSVYIYLIGAFLVVTSFLVLFLVPEKRMEKIKQKITKELIKKNIMEMLVSMKNWKLWALSFFVMGMYTFQSVFAFYLLQMMTNIFLSPPILLTVLGGVRTYALRTGISVVVGRWADKFRSYILFLLITLGLGIGLLLVFILLPNMITNNTSTAIVVLSAILYLLAGGLSWVMVTLRYTQLGEVHIEQKSYASSVGLLSFIGFSTDAYLYNVTGAIGESYTPTGSTTPTIVGYQLILAITLGVAFVGWLGGLIVFISNTIELKKLGKTDYRWRTLENV